MKRLAIITLITLALFGTYKVFSPKSEAAPTPQEELVIECPSHWKKFEAPTFSAFFPSTPVLTEVTEQNITLHEYKTEEGFSASYAELPDTWTQFGSSLVFKGAINQILEHEPGELVDKENSEHGAYPALDYRILRGDVVTHGKLVLVNNTLYKLETTEEAPTFFHFFDIQ